MASILKIFTSTLLILSINSFAQEVEQPDQEIYQGLSSSTEKSTMEVMIENEPEMKEIYQQCQTSQQQDPSINLASCVNDGFSNLDAATRADISKKYFQTEENENNYESNNITTIQAEEDEDPAINKLKKYLHDRLQEALYSDVSNQEENSGKAVSHKVFLELYKSQIGKNIITSLTSYCIEANASDDFLVYNGEDSACGSSTLDCTKSPTPHCPSCIRSVNKELLKQEQGDTVAGASQWQDCIGNVQHICYKEKGTGTRDYSTKSGAEFEYAQDRACEVTSYLKSLRQNLIKLAEVEEQFEANNENNKARSIATNVKVYTGGDDDNSIDDLTSMSSNEVTESEYDAGVEELQKLAKECREQGNEESCKKFLLAQEDADELEEANAEFAARSSALKEKMDGMDDEDKLRDYLKDEGRTDDQIEEAIANAKKQTASGDNWEETLKQQIVNKYEQERQSVIDRINAQIEGKTVENDDFSADNADVVSKITQIESELASRTEEFKELIHFNNIVSGYLEVGEDGERNTASIDRELENSAYSNEEGYQDLETAIDHTKGNAGTSDDAINMDVEEINSELLSQ